jgi:hypothetical protein
MKLIYQMRKVEQLWAAKWVNSRGLFENILLLQKNERTAQVDLDVYLRIINECLATESILLLAPAFLKIVLW